MKNLKRRTKGFTFVELLVVITIIGVIFSGGIVAYSAITQKSRNARRKADLEAIRQGLEMCRSLSGKYPALIYDSVICDPPSGAVALTKTPIDPQKCVIATVEVERYAYARPTDTTYTLSAPCMDLDGEPGYTVTNP